MQKIIRFLTNCYELAIVVGFFGSILGWLGMMGLLILGTGMADNLTGQAIMGAVIMGILFTAFEFIFLIILGASAILVDIRNLLIPEVAEKGGTVFLDVRSVSEPRHCND